MHISFEKLINASSPNDLLIETQRISASYNTSLQVISNTLWITNVGTEDETGNLINFGFYLSGKNLNSLTDILKLGTLKDEDDKPYGVFIVFGYSEEEEAYVDLFESNSLDAISMYKFQINYTQGTSALKSIPLNRAITYTGPDSTATRSIFYVNNNELSATGEGQGRIKVSLVLRLPPSWNTFNSDFTLNVTE